MPVRYNDAEVCKMTHATVEMRRFFVQRLTTIRGALYTSPYNRFFENIKRKCNPINNSHDLGIPKSHKSELRVT